MLNECDCVELNRTENYFTRLKNNLNSYVNSANISELIETNDKIRYQVGRKISVDPQW